jgi:hypothetical protein
VLAAQYLSNVARHTAQNLTASIDDVPLALHLIFFRNVGFQLALAKLETNVLFLQTFPIGSRIIANLAFLVKHFSELNSHPD